jgi:PAS domain S-box-containing protein
MEKDKITNAVYFRLATIFCLVAIGFICFGVTYFRYESDRIRNDKYEDIATIAKLKADSIQEWREYRLIDVKRAAIGRLVKRDMARLFQDPTNLSTRASLQIQLNINKKGTVYADTLFLDTKGHILLSDNPHPAPVDKATMKAIEVALKDRKEVLSDLFRDSKGIIYIDAIAPILDNSGQPIAITDLRSKAADFLYPLIQSWPTPSKTAETFLVCREGDSVLFLNELRHRSNTALTLRFPLTDTHLPAVQAVLGNYGRIFDRDYRGVDVLAVTQLVPDSSWSIVAKVDADEVLAEVKYRAWVASIIAFLLILIAAGLIIIIYRNRQRVERRKAEEALLESEEKFRTIFDRASDGILIADPISKKFLQGNTAICSMLGYTKEEIENLTINDIHPPEDISRVLDEFKKQAKGEKVLAESLPVLRKDGSIFYADISSSPTTIGGVHYLVGIFRDITDRKRAEEVLRESAEKYQRFFMTSRDCVFITSKDGNWIDMNNAAVELFGYSSREELMQVKITNLYVNPEERTKHSSIIAEHGYSMEYPVDLRRKDGAVIHTLITSVALCDAEKNVIGFQGTIRDITDRKRMEEELRDSKDHLHTLVQTIPDLIWLKDQDGVYLSCNTMFERFFGAMEADIVGKTDYDFVDRELADSFLDHDRKAMAAGKPTINEEWITFADDGHRAFLETIKMPMYDIQGTLIGVLGIGRDITERNQAEEDLKQAEERYRSIFENAQEGIFQSTDEGRFFTANRALAAMLGYDSPEDLMTTVINIPKQLYVNPEDRKVLLKMIKEQGSVRGFETQYYRKNGSMIWVSVDLQAVRDTGERVLYYEGFNEDITIKKESIERMRKALGATVQAIAVTVETRDPYTAGHQRRVADLSRAIATELNLPADQIDGIRMAATIHDLGKLSVPAEILSKPTKLTAIEFSLIKTHSQSGYDILKDIDFPWPIARTVLEHHERMNGSGYPNGLTGDNLLMESQILAVADVVESMASHRPYRPALGIDAALNEIEKNRGTLYDNAVADACLRLFREKDYQLQ